MFLGERQKQSNPKRERGDPDREAFLADASGYDGYIGWLSSSHEHGVPPCGQPMLPAYPLSPVPRDSSGGWTLPPSQAGRSSATRRACLRPFLATTHDGISASAKSTMATHAVSEFKSNESRKAGKQERTALPRLTTHSLDEHAPVRQAWPCTRKRSQRQHQFPYKG